MKNIPYGHQEVDREDIEAVVRVLRSDWLTQGPKVKEFEKALCGYTGAKYAVCVSSGTAALHLACLAAGIKNGDEAITSPMTFAASANCILYCGGRPVFADVREDTVNIDPQQITGKIGRRTKALIPVDFAGLSCDMAEISRIARKNGLIVIEDAAHALGAEYKGSKIGSCRYSNMTILSFHPVKAITTGEGGAVLTNDKKLYEKVLMLRNHGITKDRVRFKSNAAKGSGDWYYEMQYLGFNYRITDLQCALGISQLKKLDKFIARRRRIAAIYNEGLSGVKELTLPSEAPGSRSAWHIYCVRLKDPSRRKGVFDRLRKEGIGAQVHYIPVYFQPFYRELPGQKDPRCPVAERYYSQAITLPLYPQMTDSQVGYVMDSVKKSLR